MSFNLPPLALTFAIIIFAVPLMPVFAVPVSNQAPLGLAEFNITDENQIQLLTEPGDAKLDAGYFKS
jgi:hypothetical protein